MADNDFQFAVQARMDDIRNIMTNEDDEKAVLELIAKEEEELEKLENDLLIAQLISVDISDDGFGGYRQYQNPVINNNNNNSFNYNTTKPMTTIPSIPKAYTQLNAMNRGQPKKPPQIPPIPQFYMEKTKKQIDEALDGVVNDKWREILRDLTDQLVDIQRSTTILNFSVIGGGETILYELTSFTCLSPDGERSLITKFRENYNVRVIIVPSIKTVPSLGYFITIKITHPTLTPF